MKNIIDYILTVQNDNHIQAVANNEKSPYGIIAQEPLEFAEEYVDAVYDGMVNTSKKFQTLGKYLYNALFAEPIGGHFRERALREVLEKQFFLRLRLVFQEKVSPKIVNLPWEFLFYPEKQIFLATHIRCSLFREYHDWLQTPPEGYSNDKHRLRILFVHADPSDLDHVVVSPVRQAIEELKESLTQVDVQELQDPSPKGIQGKLHSYRPHVFHFLGHGRFSEPNGALALLNKNGKAFWYDAQSFSELFSDWQPYVVVLQSCEGGQMSDLKTLEGGAAWLVRQNVPAVVAMRYPIRQGMGWIFARKFYEALADRKSVDQAVQSGRNALAILEDEPAYSSRDFGSPVLWMRLRDGLLFPVKKGEPEEKEEPETEERHGILFPYDEISDKILGYLEKITTDYEKKKFISLEGETEQIIDDEDLDFGEPDVFVPPEFRVLAPPHEHQAKKKILKNDIEEVLEIHPRFILLGAPGSGKTTTLKKILFSRAQLAKTAFANGTFVKESSDLQIPLLIDLAKWPKEDIPDIPDLIQHNLKHAGLPDLHFSHFIFLFDGLNEMGTTAYKKSLSSIVEWLQKNRKLSVIFACRERDFAKFSQLSLPQVFIHPLDEKRIWLFINAYLDKREGRKLFDLIQPKTGKRRYQKRHSKRRRAAMKALIYLASNPYFLRMIVFTYQQNKGIPASKGQLFHKFIGALYEREKRRNTTSGLSYEDLVSALGNIAFYMQTKGLATSTHKVGAVKQLPAKLSSEENVKKVLRLASQASLIKLTHEEKVFQFTHQLLLEYFAAEALRRKISQLEEYIGSPKFNENERVPTPWDEVIYLLVGITDANRILKCIADIDPFLAADCLEFVPKDIVINEETRAEVTTHLISFFKPKDKDSNAQNAAIAKLKLKQLDKQTIPYLFQTLRNDILISQRLSLKALAQFPYKEAIEAIFWAAENLAKWVRRDAESIVGNFSNAHYKETLAILIENLSHKNKTHQRLMVNIVIAILDSDDKQTTYKMVETLAKNEHISFFVDTLLQASEVWEIGFFFEQLANLICIPQEDLSQNILVALTRLINVTVDNIIGAYQDGYDYKIFSDSIWIMELIEKHFPSEFYRETDENQTDFVSLVKLFHRFLLRQEEYISLSINAPIIESEFDVREIQKLLRLS